MNMAVGAGGDRFRVNVMRQRQNPAITIRRLISKIPGFDDLGLPPIMKKLVMEKRGLFFICGVTAAGKSTTLASMIDFRNSMIGGHIITIEDPIEFYHENKKGIVAQREVGIDTTSFHIAMTNVLRQKPDVIMVGEVRDSTVMEMTLAAAETGHLCYTTLHTRNAGQTVDRIVNIFREERRQQIRMALAMNLRAIVVQRLVPAVNGGLTLVTEVLLNEGLIKELILNGETNKIREVMTANNSAGMFTFDQSILRHYINGVISEETALAEAELPTDMKIKIREHRMSGKSREAMPEIDTSKLHL
jgi:twitching motility protein PilU